MTIMPHARLRSLPLIALLVVLSACAINDASQSTLAPITLNAPPETVISGQCDITGELEAWLQVTARTRQDFQNRLDEAVAKNPNDVRDDIMYLVALRDTVAATTTPDCGVEVQNILTRSMSEVVTVLQGYFNKTLSTDVTSALSNAQQGLNQAEALQNDLIARMKAQYQLENNLTPTPSS